MFHHFPLALTLSVSGMPLSSCLLSFKDHQIIISFWCSLHPFSLLQGDFWVSEPLNLLDVSLPLCFMVHICYYLHLSHVQVTLSCFLSQNRSSGGSWTCLIYACIVLWFIHQLVIKLDDIHLALHRCYLYIMFGVWWIANNH